MKKFGVLSLSVLLIGCASKPMPDELYNQFAYVSVGSLACMNKGFINPELAAKAQIAVEYTLDTWNYQVHKYNNIVNSFREHANDVTENNCRDISFKANKMVMLVEQRRGDIQAQNTNNALQGISNAITGASQKPVFCNNIAGVVVCN